MIRPSQCTTPAGIGSPDTGKFSTALRVSPPQSSAISRLHSGLCPEPSLEQRGHTTDDEFSPKTSGCVAQRRSRFDHGAGDRPARGLRRYALSFRYGQRHQHELEAAARVADSRGVESHVIARHRPARVRRLGADRRHRRAQGSRRRRLGTASRSPTSPPATRSFCRSRWPGPRCSAPSDIFIGVNALDYSGYPDCRPEYIEAFEAMANLATKAGVEGRSGCGSTRR